MLQRILLGPQRPVTNLRESATNASLPEGPFAVISAAWQEDEAYIDDVAELVSRPLVNLQLYARAEHAFQSDANLYNAYRERQELLIELQRLYRGRLRQLMIAARNLQKSDADAKLLAPEMRHAIAQLRALDRHHHNRVEAIHASYAGTISAAASPVLTAEKDEIAEQLAGCETVVITGGNVVVLLNRLRLFDMTDLLAGKNIVAWSAGAMALGESVVLFHDRTPRRRRDPELLSRGTGLIPGLIFLPDAKRRLRSSDATRIGLLSQRFAPATCVTLDSGSMLQLDDDQLRAATDVKRLSNAGLTRIRVA